MSAAYVIHAESDRSFFERGGLARLPSHGYDHWLARSHVAGGATGAKAAMRSCQVILVMLSSKTVESDTAREDIDSALESGRTLIGVQTGDLSDQDWARLPARLKAAPRVDFTAKDDRWMTGVEDALHELIAQLPPLEEKGGDATPPVGAQKIDWNEQVFSEALKAATKRHDHAAATSLVATISKHFSDRSDPYPADRAFADLKTLRQDREFALMIR